MSDFKLDFIGVGAPKAGTTWLADNLRNHPHIFLPKKKELIYFNKMMIDHTELENYRYQKDLQWYHSFFKESKPDQIKGEFSPHYFSCPYARKRIFEYNPNIKLLVILREPVARTKSSYFYGIQSGMFRYKTFEEALSKRPSIIEMSLYYDKIKAFYDIFPRENIKVIFFEEMLLDPKLEFKKVLNFLGVDEYYPESLHRQSNPTRGVRFALLNYLIVGCRRLIHRYKLWQLRKILRFVGVVSLSELITRKINLKRLKRISTIDPETERGLRTHFLPDIEKLEILLQKDLSFWKA